LAVHKLEEEVEEGVEN